MKRRWLTKISLVIGGVAMVLFLVFVFPVMALMGFGLLAVVLGSLLKGDADVRNTDDGKPNEYLTLATGEQNTLYP